MAGSIYPYTNHGLPSGYRSGHEAHRIWAAGAGNCLWRYRSGIVLGIVLGPGALKALILPKRRRTQRNPYRFAASWMKTRAKVVGIVP